MIGRQISHFYIIRALGSGGMGTVYEAQDTRLPRSVAIKVLKSALANDRDAIKRFKREARLASSLNHPNICTVLDVDEGHGEPFIAMELLHGVSLKARLAEGPLPLSQLVDVAGQIADALAAAHAQGIIHRDITPGNVFLTRGGLVKLLDFGLAKHDASLEDENDATDDLTGPGRVAGTIHYMAPERFDTGRDLDHRSDLFSLGAVIYQMATGARPFDIAPRQALIEAIEKDPHVPLRQLAPQLPGLLGSICDKLLAKRPDDRYQTAAALRADLEPLRIQTVPDARPGHVGAIAIAVMSFDLVGGASPEAETFRDGLATDIRSRLTRIERLRVAPRASTRSAAGLSLREMGKALGVDVVLEGTVQHGDDRVRVTATLVDAVRERAIAPAFRMDQALAHILETQDAIAEEIVLGVDRALGRSSPSRSTKEPEAHHALKRGQHRWRSCFTGGWRPAIEHFEYAIERDPHFAPAHVALAHAYNFLGFYCLTKPALAFGVARHSAERALALDETLGDAHVERALAMLGGEWDWDAAELSFRQALSQEPGSANAHVHYAWLLMLLGREDAALSEAQRGYSLAPASLGVAGAYAETLFLAGRYDGAIEICNECLRFDRDYVFAIHLRGLCYLALSSRDSSVTDLERAATLSGRVPFHLGLLGRCYGQFGLREQALGLISELRAVGEDTYVPPQAYVFIYAGLGERDRALEYQEKAYEDGASPFNYLTPCIRDLYALDPYHKRRLEQMRLRL